MKRESQIQSEIPGNNVINENKISDSKSEKENIFPHVCLPYKGKEGERILRELKGVLNKYLPKEVKPRFIYKGKKLCSFLRIKDQVKTEHQSGLVYGYYDNLN